MLQANISDIKNRLSYYLKLVRGGEEIEILDRKTPVARIIHISQVKYQPEEETPWIQEAKDHGLISEPANKRVEAELLNADDLPAAEAGYTSGVLQALFQERDEGR
ncbi:MAG: type II toxin-antitoxin system Phd/YefM family antitoxin [Desulfovermiculus sp.]